MYHNSSLGSVVHKSNLPHADNQLLLPAPAGTVCAGGGRRSSFNNLKRGISVEISVQL
jgi:hypothetical protein